MLGPSKLEGSPVKRRIEFVGNSRGVRLPSALLEQFRLKGDVELVVEGGYLVIRTVTPPRQGWAAEARLMAERGDDRLIPGYDSQYSEGDESDDSDGPDPECVW